MTAYLCKWQVCMPMVGNSTRKAFPMERLYSNPENAEKSRTREATHAKKKQLQARWKE